MTTWTESKAVEYPMWDKNDKEIEGILKEKRAEVGPNNSMIYVLEAKGGETIGVWGSAVLDNRMKQLPIGTEVKIVYNGLAKSKRGTKYHDFQVFYNKETMPEKDISDVADEVFNEIDK